MKQALNLILMLLFATAPLLALEPANILETVDRKLSPPSYESYRKLINIEPDGSRREFILYTVKKGNDRVASLFLSPASEMGRAMLRLDENMWLYIPNVGKPIRTTSIQSVVGGVFNNADIMRLDYNEEYEAEKMEDNGNTYLLHLTAKNQYVAYGSLKMTVDKQELLPLEIECYAATGMLIKTLHFREIKTFDGGVRRPSVIETDSPLYEGYKSVMIFAQIKKRELADEIFTLNFLPRLETIR
ncbi:outer membrane lipoprotein-sorting protein [candidate division KSB1 bacterium]